MRSSPEAGNRPALDIIGEISPEQIRQRIPAAVKKKGLLSRSRVDHSIKRRFAFPERICCFSVSVSRLSSITPPRNMAGLQVG